MAGLYRVVQPWGRDKARQATLISEHAAAAKTFADIDRLSAQMVRTGASSDGFNFSWSTPPASWCPGRGRTDGRRPQRRKGCER